MKRLITFLLVVCLVLFSAPCLAAVIGMGDGYWGDSVTGELYFHDHGNGLVYDYLNDMTWLQDADYFRHVDTHALTRQFVDGLLFGNPPTTGPNKPYPGPFNYEGYYGWRLPRLGELHSIVDRFGQDLGGYTPFINVLVSGYNIPEFMGDQHSWGYWASDIIRDGSENSYTFLNFLVGLSYSVHIDHDPRGFIWPVHSGNIGAPTESIPDASIMFLLGPSLAVFMGIGRKAKK